MKILIFSYLSRDNNNYKGGGWVDSAINILKNDHEVGVVYMSRNKNGFKEYNNNIVYYPYHISKSFYSRIIKYINHNPQIDINYDYVDSIINDFNPDIIQLFGLETPFATLLQRVTKYPIVVHIQGLCNPYLEKWLPSGFTKWSTWINSNLKDRFFLRASYDNYLRLKRMAALEAALCRNFKYYLGRTDWDYYLIKYLSPESVYFKCDEVLRDVFYNKKWEYVKRKPLVISTTMNGEIYKGFDTILRTAQHLKQRDVNFEWNIYGVCPDDRTVILFEKTLGRKFSDNNISFKGRVESEELSDALLTSSFYVHASHIDNSPNSLCESMIMGVPSIATYVGGVPSIINNFEDGFLLPDSEPLFLASLIMELVDNRVLLTDISNNSRNRALQRHSKEIILEQLNVAYDSIIEDFQNI